MWLTAAVCQAERLAGGLRDLIGQANRQPQERQLVRLDTLLDDLQRVWSPVAATANVRLRVLSRAVSVRSEPNRLRSILDNLIGNAIKYSPDGRILVGWRIRSGLVAVDICDTGGGIAEVDQERIFAAFCQLDSSADGLGLGLSIVRDHCAALGHRLELMSRPGRGSRFRLILGDPKAD